MGGKTTRDIAASHRILDGLLEGCQIVDRDYRYVYLNHAVVAHSRRDRDELIGRTMPEVYPGIEDTEMFAHLRRAMTEREPQSCENEFVYPDGSRAWFDLRFEPVDEGVLILSIDISKRKRTEQALERTVRSLATVSRCNQTLLRATDESQLIEDICRLVVSLGGYQVSWLGLLDSNGHLRPIATGGVTDAEWTELVEADWLEEPGLRAIRDDEPALAGAGENRLGLVSSIALPVHQRGEPIGALSIYSDNPRAFEGDVPSLLLEVAMDLGYGIEVLRARASREEVERRLEESERLEAVGRLAGGVAHDFNNLLSVILSYATLVMDQVDSPEVHADINEIHQAGLRAAALTRQLLAFSRKQALEPKVTDLNAVVAGIERMLRRLLGEHITIEIRAASDLGRVLADPGQLEQVIVNLAVNARDAMTTGGKLIVETDNVELDESYTERHVSVSPGSYVLLTISDTGPGMPEEIRARAFEPFFTTKGEDSGTGLGLATVYGIVKQSGGHVHLYSELGRGTSFKIYLPRVDAEAASGELAAPISSGDETVLIVEDEGAVRRAATRVLRAAGYQVLSAASGEEALALCERYNAPIDLLLSDVVMPGMSGRELADELGRRYPNLAVLFTSGFTDDAITHHGVLAPGTQLISKPFAITDLTRKIRAILDSR